MGDGVIITGCDSGIGKETAEFLSKQGYEVVACVYEVNTAKTFWASELEKKTGNRVFIQELDLRSSASIKGSIKNIKALKLSIRCLVNVAGVAKDAVIQMSARSDIRDVYEVNVFGQIEFSQYALKVFNKVGNKSIIFVSSTAAFAGGVGQLAYASSKAAIANVTKTFSRELGPLGFNVNAVAPGVIDTQMYNGINPQLIERRINKTSLKRMGRPVEVAQVIGFLLSESSKHITGQVIRVDGGLL